MDTCNDKQKYGKIGKYIFQDSNIFFVFRDSTFLITRWRN